MYIGSSRQVLLALEGGSDQTEDHGVEDQLHGMEEKLKGILSDELKKVRHLLMSVLSGFSSSHP
jgi:hypothetical protein